MSAITWKNVSAPDARGAGAIASAGAKQMQDAFLGLQNTLQGRDKRLTKDATGQAVAALMGAQTPDALQAAYQSFQGDPGMADAGEVAKLFADRTTGMLNDQRLALGNTGLQQKNATFMESHDADMAYKGANTDFTKVKTAGAITDNKGKALEVAAMPTDIENRQKLAGANINFREGQVEAQDMTNMFLPKRLQQEENIRDSEVSIKATDAAFAPKLSQASLDNTYQGIKKSNHDMSISGNRLALDQQKHRDAQNRLTADAMSTIGADQSKALAFDDLMTAYKKGDKSLIQEYLVNAQKAGVPKNLMDKAEDLYKVPDTKGGIAKMSPFAEKVFKDAGPSAQAAISDVAVMLEINKGTAEWKDSKNRDRSEKLSKPEQKGLFDALAKASNNKFFALNSDDVNKVTGEYIASLARKRIPEAARQDALAEKRAAEAKANKASLLEAMANQPMP